MIINRHKRLLSILMFLTGILSISAKEKDYVLYLSSISLEEAWVNNFYKELDTRLIEHSELDLKTFHLDVPLIKNETEVAAMQQKILRQFPTPPKVVVMIGDPGWLVSAPLFDGPWKNIPIILCYSRELIPANIPILLSKVRLTPQNSIPIAEFNKKYNITVLRHPYFIPETLKLMQQLQPNVKKIALISDDRYISVVTRQSIQQVIKKNYPHLTLELLSANQLSSEELLDTLSTYDSTTGVIYYSWFRQYRNKNTTYLSDHIRKILPTFLKVPVYTLTDLNLQENLFVGGHYISITDFTDTAMSVIEKILAGQTASSIPYQDGGTAHTYLNYADLRWRNIPESLYPSDAIYCFTPPTFYQQYKVYIWMISLFFILFAAFYRWHYIHSKRDKEELIKAKERAEESDRLKSAFLANMSHEIRTPLNAIVGFSSILAESVNTPENCEYIKIIEKNNYLLLQLINDVLDISRIEAGLFDFTYTNTDCNFCLQELENSFRFRIPRNVAFIKESAFETCIIYMEKNRVIQILGNYLSNAIKHTTQGNITIGYYPPENGKIRFYVRDTGSGIPADKHKEIFERFVKLDNFKQGTGLGLSICRMVADKMNASVGIISENRKGSEFWLELPYHPVEVR